MIKRLLKPQRNYRLIKGEGAMANHRHLRSGSQPHQPTKSNRLKRPQAQSISILRRRQAKKCNSGYKYDPHKVGQALDQGVHPIQVPDSIKYNELSLDTCLAEQARQRFAKPCFQDPASPSIRLWPARAAHGRN